MRKFIVPFLAFIGGLSIVGALIGWFLFGGLSGDTTFEGVSELKSPSGRLMAVTYVSMGGGAAGYCNKIVSVMGSGGQISIKSANRALENQAFRGSCGSRVVANWVSDSLLQIEFAGPSSPGGLSVYMNPSVQANKVRVQFVLKPS